MIIRVWNFQTVVGVLSVGKDGGSAWIGPAGGASNSTKPDIEFDPWAGLIVDHTRDHPVPVSTRETATCSNCGQEVDND